MHNNFRYELTKIKQDIKYMYILIGGVQLLSLVFFTVVGKVDKDENSIL